MPGGNGTGPAGRGPLTGRGHGYCVCRMDELSPKIAKAIMHDCDDCPKKKKHSKAQAVLPCAKPELKNAKNTATLKKRGRHGSTSKTSR